MKKLVISIMVLLVCSNSTYSVKASNKNDIYKAESANTYGITMKQDILSLMMAYPEHIVNVERKENGNVYIVMKSGKKVLYDDKKSKSFDEKLANPDLQDMMEQNYPLITTRKLMDKNFDPGRLRVYDILEEVYGRSKQQIESNLKNVSLGYKRVQFNSNNKAAESLQTAMKELIPLAQQRGDIGGCLFPSSGTFNYRLISGTNRLSPHSFGIAIDLARDRRDYWKWASKEEGERRLSIYPKEIVEVFEKNNFVWGGKWSHFDTLHFEYRPEIIFKARYFGDKNNSLDLWYSGVPLEESNVKDYIQKINDIVK